LIAEEEVEDETKVSVSTFSNSTMPLELAPPEQQIKSELIKVKAAKLIVGSKAK
jgi:hypothetical protein